MPHLRIFTGAPTLQELDEDSSKTSHNWQTATSLALPRFSGPFYTLPPATLASAERRISLLYENIIFDDDFDKAVNKHFFSPNITHLRFGKRFNQVINSSTNSIPQNLTFLQIGKKWNQRVTLDTITCSLLTSRLRVLIGPRRHREQWYGVAGSESFGGNQICSQIQQSLQNPKLMSSIFFVLSTCLQVTAQ